MSNQEKPSLKDLVNKISSGVGSIGKKKPTDEATEPVREPTIELGSVIDADNERATPAADQHPEPLEPLEPLVASGDGPTPKKTSKLANLTMGQKLIAAVLVVAVVLFAKGQMEGAPEMAKSKADTTQESSASSDEGIPFGTDSVDELPAQPAPQDDLALPGAPGTSQANEQSNIEPDPFDKQGGENQAPPAFGGLDQPLNAPENLAGTSPDLAAAAAVAPSQDLAAAAAAVAQPPVGEPALFAQPGMEEPNPFGNSTPVAAQGQAEMAPTPVQGNQPPVFAGTPSASPDSGSAKEVPVTRQELAKANADLASQAEKIAALEKKLAKAEEKLNLANQAKPAAPQRHVAQAPVKSQQAKASPVTSTKTRPRICVKAVAAAARNCTTCVAHAFIVRGGVEDMVGQGDFLDGYHVSIVGDRLDLQDSNGQVAHKYWSSTNGCAAI